LASLLPADIYRHQSGLKHINVSNSDGFSALFVVNTPVFDNSGVAHGVEHMVFRGSIAFPQPETLFQLTSLTDAKINASTFANKTYFHCQSQCAHTFILAVNYLLNGLFNPVFNAEDLPCEIHDGNDKGVIYQELIASEQAEQKSTKKCFNNKNDKNNFFYGGISASIGDLSLNDLTDFHQRFYQASNITLVTANADIEQISYLITLLPKQSKQIQAHTQGNAQKRTQENKSNEHHQKKYPAAINKLITHYHLWLHDPYYQEVENYKEVTQTERFSASNTDSLTMLPHSNLIPFWVTLSNKLVKNTINEQTIDAGISLMDIKKPANKTLLPNLFSKLCLQAKKQLTINDLSQNKANGHQNHVGVSDQRNALWLTIIGANEQILATITSYIISAHPKFLAPRCQGLCYATQALTIENSAYLAIYNAFDVNPNTRLKEVPLCLLKLSQDKNFISMSLDLAKIKYCRAYQTQSSQVINITTTDISNYLQVLANDPHPKV